MSTKINYITSPEIREARDLLGKVRDQYVYGLFDVLKLGIPPSEQLSKALTKITAMGSEAADQVERYLRSVDDSDNFARSKNAKDRAREIRDESFRRVFSVTLVDHFSKCPPGQVPPANFVYRAEIFGKFIFTDPDRNAFFQSELLSLESLFWEKRIIPFLEKYKLTIQRTLMPDLNPIPVTFTMPVEEKE